MSDSSETSSDPAAQPEFEFDGRYRVEKVGDDWYLRGPVFTGSGSLGMHIRGGGETPELVRKYRDLAELLNSVVDAERKR